jgi:hypothetical protein
MATFIPSVPNFTPWFIFPSEYAQYGLPPSPTTLAQGQVAPQPDIDNLVQFASSLIDQHCGRCDGDGNGSLVYTTYQERLLFQAPGRNLTMLPMKPVAAISTATAAAIMALDAASGGYYYTGFIPNTIYTNFSGQLSAVLACSGRYGYVRRDQSQTYPDLNALINPQNLISLFGGPPPWIAVDLTNLDYDPKTGEVWIPAGLQLQRYSEIIITYNSGYDPRYLPRAIKQACAAVTKNLMLRGGVTGIQGQSLGRAAFNVTMTPGGVIDGDVERLLRAFVALRAY